MRKIDFKVALFLLALVSIIAVPVFAQNKSETITPNPPNYEFLIGDEVALAFMNGCFVLQGTIEDADDSRVNFLIQEKILGGDDEPESIELEYVKSPTKISEGFLNSSPWRFAKIKKGNELLVFRCRGRKSESGYYPRKFAKEYPFITSDRKLISGIKKSVEHFVSFKKNPGVILEIPELIKSENDLTFIGYLFSFIAEGGAIQQSDNTALLLSQLLESDKIPDNVSLIAARSQLIGLVSGSNWVFPISQATRETVIKNLISTGGSDKKLAMQAIIVLSVIVNEERLDLTPYLNPDNKNLLLKKMQTISLNRLSENSRKKFEILLID